MLVAWMVATGNGGVRAQDVRAQDVLPGTVAVGASSQTGWMPDDQSNSAGFECSVELNGSIRPGYVKLDFLFTFPVASTTERSLVARILPRSPGMLPRRNQVEVDLPLVIEQGVTRVQVTRFFPKWTFGNSYSIELFEGGRSLDGYSVELGENQSGRRIVEQILEQEISSSWLFVKPGSASDKNLQALLGELRTWMGMSSIDGAQGIRYTGSRGFVSPQGASPRLGVVSSLGEDELPDDWRTYQSYGSVALEVSTYQQLRSARSIQFSALRQWVLLGGNLVILGLDPEIRLSNLLDGSDLLEGSAKEDNEDVLAEETFRARQELVSQPELVQNQSFENEQSSELEALMEIGLQRHSFGGGQVVSLSKEFPRQERDWVIAKELLSKSTSPALRRGVDPLFGDSRFRRWLIPGVAQPPVYTFMGLLTMFVVLVGPVAYRFTTRRGRGYLMFAIAPVLAVLTTLSMFAYGIVADGFGTVARMRQITWIDGATGEAVTRNRGTYFAGIRPANGLRFDAESEVMWYPDPLEMPVNELLQMASPTLGTVTIGPTEQRFSPSFLPSRQQRQFVVHQAIPNAGALTVKRLEAIASGNGEAPRVSLEVSNGLAMELSQVVICDLKGDFWSVDLIGPRSVVTVESRVMPKDRSKMLGDLYNEQRMMEENSGASRSRRRSDAFDLILSLSQFFDSGGEVNDGALENWLRERMQLGGSIDPGMYIGLAAIDSRFIATEDTELVDSIHFVIGTMP